MIPPYRHGVLIHNYHEDQHGGWNYEKQKTVVPHKTPTSISHVAHDWKPYSKIPPNPTLPSKDPLCGYLFYGHSGNINDPTTEFQKTEFVGSNKYFYRPPKDSYTNPEEPVIHSYLDDPDPKWSTLRKASSTSRIELKYGSQNKDPYETTHRVELYGKDHTIRRAPSLPTVPIARIDYVTDPKRFSHDADAGWRRMNLRRAP
jgi:hypothetical protein